MVEKGALAGIGSHGEFRMNNHDVLKVATVLGAEALGLDSDLG